MDDRIQSEEGRSRRRFLKRAGTVAWSAPFIVTMMSRSAQAQVLYCGTLDFDTLTCEVTQACGSTQECIPSVNPGMCVCSPSF
jgi:hypothetical protein